MSGRRGDTPGPATGKPKKYAHGKVRVAPGPASHNTNKLFLSVFRPKELSAANKRRPRNKMPSSGDKVGV